MSTITEEFITVVEACRLIPGGLDRRTFPKLAAKAGIRCRVLPGRPIRYSRSDVEALARAAIRPAIEPDGG